MKTLRTLLLCLPRAAIGEELPDSAPNSDEDPAAMAERFAAPPMDSEEMQSLYLESPLQVENAEEKGGLESLSDEDRYKETDLLFRERFNSDRLLPVPSLEPDERDPAAPVTPMRQL
jgi:hypothetical protein